MLSKEEIIKGLRIERECVSRGCDRDCGSCREDGLCEHLHMDVRPDWFCADGERRDQDVKEERDGKA